MICANITGMFPVEETFLLCVCSSGDRALPSGGRSGGSIPPRRVRDKKSGILKRNHKYFALFLRAGHTDDCTSFRNVSEVIFGIAWGNFLYPKHFAGIAPFGG